MWRTPEKKLGDNIRMMPFVYTSNPAMTVGSENDYKSRNRQQKYLNRCYLIISITDANVKYKTTVF